MDDVDQILDEVGYEQRNGGWFSCNGSGRGGRGTNSGDRSGDHGGDPGGDRNWKPTAGGGNGNHSEAMHRENPGQRFPRWKRFEIALALLLVVANSKQILIAGEVLGREFGRIRKEFEKVEHSSARRDAGRASSDADRSPATTPAGEPKGAPAQPARTAETPAPGGAAPPRSASPNDPAGSVGRAGHTNLHQAAARTPAPAANPGQAATAIRFVAVHGKGRLNELFDQNPEVRTLFVSLQGNYWVFNGTKSETVFYVALPRAGMETRFKALVHNGALGGLRMVEVRIPESWSREVIDTHLDRWSANAPGVSRQNIEQWSRVEPLDLDGTQNRCESGGVCLMLTRGWAPRAFADFNGWLQSRPNEEDQ